MDKQQALEGITYELRKIQAEKKEKPRVETKENIIKNYCNEREHTTGYKRFYR